MRAHVRVVKRSEYDRFLTNASAGASKNPGETVFTTAGCGACHTFTPAGTDAQVGPSLDAIKPTGGKSLEEFIHQSIVDPNAVITEGYQPDVMPKTFSRTLSNEQLDALVQYLVDGQKGSK
jgi:mono/diheme cytochrome c family protein